MEWKQDPDSENDLKRYLRENMQRNEILNFVQRDYPQYCWSMRTLDRRLRHYGICYIDHNVIIDEARAAVQEELEGPGHSLGYRAIRQKYASSMILTYRDTWSIL